MPATLVAQVVEHLANTATVEQFTRWMDAALARPWAASDHDAVRRIAAAAVHIHAPAARDLAAHFAWLCDRAERASPPLAWPRRTRGPALRVVVLRGAYGAAEDTLAMLVALPPARFAVTVAQHGRDDASGESLMLPAAPTAVDARRIAALDPDVIVDLAGLHAPIGILLAQRPARLRLTLAALPAFNPPPLTDEIAADSATLLARIKQLQATLPEAAAGMPDAPAMTERWTEAVALHQRAERAGARARYAEVLSVQPEFAPAHRLLGTALAEDGDLGAARAAYAAALAAAPGFVDARVAAIRAAVEAGDSAAATALAREGLEQHDPAPASLLRAVGSARLAVQDGAGAAQAFEAALAQEPIDGETHYNHGVALQMQRAHAEAARAYQRALTFRPDLVAADFNLGVIFAEEGNGDAAIHAFAHVLERNPAHVQAYRNLGEALLAAGRVDEWQANFLRFEAQCPDALPLAVHALEASQWTGDFRRVDRYLEDLRKERFRAADEHELLDALEELLYILLFFDVEADLYQRVAQTYDATARKVYGEPLPPAPARRPGHLRVGYLSADLRNHVMGKMMWQAIGHHDRRRFDIRFFSTSAVRDAWTERFIAAGDAFTVIAGMTDRAAADAIAAADLDVLVDLSTHTRGARPGILARKPARVQITHVASAGLLGLSTMDFRLTDAHCDVIEGPPAKSETLLPMEGCVYPWRHVEPADVPALSRQALRIASDAIVIGAFVTGMKLSRRCLALWRDVLARLPQARLAFSPLNAALAPLYVRIAAAGGIAGERLIFVPQGADDAQNQARYRLVDFVLDPLPYGGVNGTIEALDMGVPVVTLVGRRHSERTTYSILANLGVNQTIADSGKHYVDIAVRLGTDAAFMREVRSAIRAGTADSPLVDMAAHARHLEDAYRTAVRLRAPFALTAADAEAGPAPE